MIKKILISQPKPASEKSPYFDLQRKHGIELVFHPFVLVEGISATEFRQQKVNVLAHTAVVFTSRHAIENFFKLCKELRIVIPDDMKYFVISENVALYIQKYVQYRKRKVFFPAVGKLPELVAVMQKHKTEKFLLPKSENHTDELSSLLDEKKLNHTDCVMFRTVANEFPKDKPFDFDLVVLFTQTGLDGLLQTCPDFRERGIKLGCFGKTAKNAIAEAGLEVDLEAPTPEAPSMTGSLDFYLAKHNK